jgi:thiosulfate/3-mercaptopyruvate sulfurtransferase
VEDPRPRSVWVAALNPLVSTDWLGNRLHDESLRIADCRFYLAEPGRGRREYLAGHIPTALYFSLDDDLTGSTGPGRHPLPDAVTFAAAVGQRGISKKHAVVVYDDQGGGIAARLWWMLRSLGHQRVHVLDGGWAAWTSEPRSVTTEIPIWRPALFEAWGDWSGLVDREKVATDESLLLIDARAPERYRGEVEPIDPIPGHIPGAFNIPYTGNVNTGGHHLDAEALRERFAIAAGDAAVVSYCGSGVTACSNLLALAIAGFPDALLYAGSWSDWCTTGGEISTA